MGLLSHHSLLASNSRLKVRPCPFDSEQARLEEFLVGVFLAYILPSEILFAELLSEQLMTGQELLFCVAREEHKRVALQQRNARQ